jgi:Zn-dependent alcohol dehydrogenase
MDSTGGSTDPNLDIPKYLDFYRRGLLRLDSLITHRVPLDKINDGLDIMRQGIAGRVIVEMP